MQYLNAIQRSDAWPNTAVVIVWDDFGGFYDHLRRRDTTSWAWGPARRP